MKKKVLSAAIFAFGVILLVYTWKPIFEWHFFFKPNLAKKSVTFLSPLPKSLGGENFVQTNRSNLDNQSRRQINDTTTFFLTIEKFKIEKARVVTGDDFLRSLAHLPHSALPGQVGNVVISGHSVLPQFFSPSNYFSIFSKLYLLETGDAIVVEYQNKSYIYRVSEMLVVTPSDLWVLEPSEPYAAYLTLLTCSVGGLPQERIIVRATLQDFQKVI